MISLFRRRMPVIETAPLIFYRESVYFLEWYFPKNPEPVPSGLEAKKILNFSYLFRCSVNRLKPAFH